MKFVKLFSCAALAIASTSVLASGDTLLSEYNYDYTLRNNIALGTDADAANAITVMDRQNIDGIDVVVSTWSDTKWDPNNSGANLVVGGKSLNRYGDGYGLTNQDEKTHQVPGHSFDNQWHNNETKTDFDFIMFSFDEAVTLDSANFSWLWNKNSTEVSVGALNDTGLNDLTSGTKTWSQIASNAVTKSFDVSGSTYSSNFDIDETSKYWIVGAYNTVFGSVANSSMYNDGFKISGISFSKELNPGPIGPDPKPVSAPGSLAILLAGLGLMAARRQRKQA